MLLLLILSILFINIIMLCIGSNFFKFNVIEIKIFTLALNLITFVLSLFLWLFFDNNIATFQFITNLNADGYIPLLFGIDGYSLILILITTFIFPICIITNWSENFNCKFNLICLLLIEFFIIITFSSLDIFIFFLGFEGTLIPMFLLIGGWGNNVRKIKASYYFFIYTFFGSIFLLFNLLFLFSQYGTLNYVILINLPIPFSTQLLVWVNFFLPFAIKAPLFPFHVWLPEAHVESPTSGSIIIASILLKLGTYGMLRFLVPLCPDANLFFLPLVYTFLLVGLLYTSLTTIRQTDLKRLIAYSSIAHMTYATIGLVTFNYYSLQGAILLMIAHGFTSTGLFFIVGIIYKRSHTRILNYYSGIVSIMPLFTIFLFLFCVANFSLPITFNFIGEFLILIGIIQQNFFVGVFSTLSIFLSLIYSMWFFNRLGFGNLKLNYISLYVDISRQEVYILIPVTILMFFFGIFPNLIISSLDITIKLNLF